MAKAALDGPTAYEYARILSSILRDGHNELNAAVGDMNAAISDLAKLLQDEPDLAESLAPIIGKAATAQVKASDAQSQMTRARDLLTEHSQGFTKEVLAKLGIETQPGGPSKASRKNPPDERSLRETQELARFRTARKP